MRDVRRPGRDGVRLLIVDDSNIVADRLAALLRECAPAFRIVGRARDAVQALKGVRELQPDAVILDIHSPDRSGVEVLEDVKRMPDPPVVIILTNYPLPQYH